MEVFWKTIAQYNEGTWIAQIVITVVGILLTILLYQKPTLLVKRLMKGYMVFLNSWISIVYYMIVVTGITIIYLPYSGAYRTYLAMGSHYELYSV